MKAWWMLLLMPLAAMGADKALHSRDFAFGMTLEVDGDGALYTLPVPDTVYSDTVRPDLGDMRIFNGFGEVVPHLIQQGEAEGKLPEDQEKLNFFPLYQGRSWEQEINNVVRANDGSGAIIDIARSVSDGIVDHYLIDATGVETAIKKLMFDWNNVGEGFMVPIRIEYSNDLVHWYHLIAAAPLADLTFEGHRLARYGITMPRQEARYYRISWPLTDKGIFLKEVRVESVYVSDMPSRQWRTLSPDVAKPELAHYIYSLEGNYPLDNIKVELPRVNAIMQAKLLSRSDEKSPWRVRHQGLFYTLQRDGITLSNESIALPLSTDSYWRLELEQVSGEVQGEVPKLKVGWIPHRLIFAARGEMPFILAFGAATVEPLRGGTTPLKSRLKQKAANTDIVKLAHVGVLYELGGKDRLLPPPPPLPWKKWLLWALLVLGILSLAIVIRGRYRSVNKSGFTE